MRQQRQQWHRGGGKHRLRPLTKKQFVAQANQICQKGLEEKDEAVNEAREELPAQVLQNPTPKALAILVEQTVIPAYQDLIDQLNQLDAPKGEEAAVEKIVTKYEAGLKIAKALPGKAVDKNPFEAANQAAEAYGLEMCRL